MAYIQSNASGETIHLTDSADSKVVEFGLYGKAEQNGTPTSDAPVDIEVAGASGSVVVESVGKNQLDISAITHGYPDATIGASIDDIVASTRYAHSEPIEISEPVTIQWKANSGLDYIRYFLYKDGIYQSQKNLVHTSDGTHTIPKSDSYDTMLLVVGTTSAIGTWDNSYLVECQIEYGTEATPYEPYKSTTSLISTPEGLAGINGVCDEIIKYADGSGKRIQRIFKETFSIDDNWESTTTQGRTAIRTPKKSLITDYSWLGKISNIATNVYIGDSYCVFETSLSLEEFKTAINDLTVEVLQPLKEPIITDLTAEEIAEIEKLHTFYPVTNISNDAECNMFIKYNTFRYEWVEPKTDWKSTDRFNFSDYNRIKNNLIWLHAKSEELWKKFNIEDMGEDITSYATYWNVDMFNAFENNLEQINKNTLSKNYGTKQVFFENAPFIQYEELNRIESAMLSIYDILKRQELTIRRIPFRLGTFKEVRI